MAGYSKSLKAVSLRMIIALALVLVGFAHRPMAQAADLSAYTLPDGTVPILCLTVDEDGKARPMADRSDCEACRLVHAVTLPEPAATLGERMKLALETLAIERPEAFVKTIRPPSAAPRAPPVDPAIA